MKEYPSIPNLLFRNDYIWAQAKFDGSQIRGEWNSKRGFYKFGTRRELIDEKASIFGKSIPLIKNKYEEDLGKVFKEQGWRDALCFFEFFGPNSFAGQHQEEDDFDVVLFDVNPLRKGILEPDQFIELFSHLHIPKVLFEGFIDDKFISSVKNGTLKNMPLEGVVCKGKHEKGRKTPIMFKIKSQAWLLKLKDRCNDDELFEKLK